MFLLAASSSQSRQVDPDVLVLPGMGNTPQVSYAVPPEVIDVEVTRDRFLFIGGGGFAISTESLAIRRASIAIRCGLGETLDGYTITPVSDGAFETKLTADPVRGVTRTLQNFHYIDAPIFLNTGACPGNALGYHTGASFVINIEYTCSRATGKIDRIDTLPVSFDLICSTAESNEASIDAGHWHHCADNLFIAGVTPNTHSAFFLGPGSDQPRDCVIRQGKGALSQTSVSPRWRATCPIGSVMDVGTGPVNVAFLPSAPQGPIFCRPG